MVYFYGLLVISVCFVKWIFDFRKALKNIYMSAAKIWIRISLSYGVNGKCNLNSEKNLRSNFKTDSDFFFIKELF